jgi:DNA-binding response OmpR family regulator
VQTILVVDDDPAIRDALALLLEDEGYVVHTAPDGLAALEVVARDSLDLVITDLYMPGLDGPGLIAQMRCERSDLPIIVASAGIRVSPPAGVPFVTKPFDSEELLAIVTSLLGS